MTGLSNYQIVNVFLLMFDSYTVYKYMRIMLKKTGGNRMVEMLSYFGYFIYAALFYIFLNAPVVLMISNFIAYVVLTFNYKASIKRRILSAILIFVIHVCIELGFTVIYFRYKLVNTYTINDIPAPLSFYIIVRIATYTLYLIISKYLKFSDINLPTSLWFCIFLIPLISLISFLFILETRLIKNSWILLALIIVLLIVNLSVFYLYNVISAAFAEKYKYILISKQNEYYNNQFEIMKNSLKLRNTEKHDLKNHLSAIETLLYMDEKGKAIEHISKIIDLSSETKEYSASGNIVIDSILNYKLQEANQNMITFNLELSVPENLNISSFNMTVILGNIIDNAINATKKLKENKMINMIISYNKGRLFITIDNTYNGEIMYESGKITTLHNDKENHGIGLNNVRTILEKYNGTMEIEHSDDVFSITILMFV